MLFSVQVSRSVVSDSLRPHESQHARPPCPSPTSGVRSDSHPSSQWCHPAISSSVLPFSSCLQSLPGSESFPMSQLFTWGGQSTGASALASVLPKNTRADLLQNGLVGSPCSPRDSQESSPASVLHASVLGCSPALSRRPSAPLPSHGVQAPSQHGSPPSQALLSCCHTFYVNIHATCCSGSGNCNFIYFVQYI